MKIPAITQLMKHPCEFLFYQDNRLWYRAHWWEPVPGTPGMTFQPFDFPVPLGDDTGGVFLAEMKAINMMRWIRKHIEFLTEAKRQAQEDDGG